MKKIFSVIALMLMTAVGVTAQAATRTVTFNTSTDGKTINKDGVTCTYSFDSYNNLSFGGTFSVSSGEFTKIEVTADDCFMAGYDSNYNPIAGWSTTSTRATWTGNSSTVAFGRIMGNSSPVTIVFTIEEPTVAVTSVSLSQTEATLNIGETLTLTPTVLPDNATDKSVTWTTSDATVATVADGVVTAVAAGTATITATATNGTADDTSDDKTATCTVTVAEPTYNITLKEGTEDADNWTITPTSAKAGETVTITYNGTKKVKSVKAVVEAEAVAAVDLSKLTADYTAQDGEVLTGTLPPRYCIRIAAYASVTLKDVTVNSIEYGIVCEGNATIILSGNNTVTGGGPGYAAVAAADNSTMTITGTGSLIANVASGAAGIGADSHCINGNIVISGGTITATGGKKAAGIGCGDSGYCGTITITDTVTKVTATKGDGAQHSIGQGRDGRCGTVTIGGTTGYISESPYTYEP